jgi:hypothetical protein
MLASLYKDAFVHCFVSVEKDPETYKLYARLWNHYLTGPKTPEKCVPDA